MKLDLNTELGAIYSHENTTFRVWAPTASAMALCLYKSGDPEQTDEITRHKMTQNENGTWEVIVKGDQNRVYYTYLVTIDGTKKEVCDPYAKAVGVNGYRAMVVDLKSTNPSGWDKDENPNKDLNVTDVVLYETHIRDLTTSKDSGIQLKGTFLGAASEDSVNSYGEKTGMSHIKDLGVTHVHFLPFYDFGSVDETGVGEQYNWGYDPVNYFVPEGSYSTDPYHGEVRIKELKEMIKTYHKNGLSVVMDVVFNHVHDADSFCFNQLVPGYFSRISERGEYSNGSGCGNDTASEREMVRKYIVENVLYWATEYHIDGFRFDLVGLIDVETINELVKRVHEIRPDVLFYGEGWTMHTIPVKEGVQFATQNNTALTGNFAYFNDTLRNALRGDNFDETHRGYINGALGLSDEIKSNLLGSPYWAFNPNQVINYHSCHDDMTIHDKFLAADKKLDEKTLLQMCKLSASIVILSQGIPFIMGGEELFRSKKNKEGILLHNTYNAGDEINELKWDDLHKDGIKELKEYYKWLITFRKEHPVFRLCDAQEIRSRISFYGVIESETIICQMNCEGIENESCKEITMIFNPDHKEIQANISDMTINIPPIATVFLVDGVDVTQKHL